MGGQLILFVVLGTFGVGGIASPLKWSNFRLDAPEKCCLPKQWSAHMTVLESINSEMLTVLNVQMDYGGKKQALLNYTGSKTVPVSKVVIDYEKEILYAVQTNYTQYCYKVPLSMPLIQCMPDDAEYLGDSYLGPMGSGLAYEGWRIRANTEKFKGVFTLAMSKKGCVPLVEGVSLSTNPSQDQLYLFSGFRPGLTDPSAFDLPDSCFK